MENKKTVAVQSKKTKLLKIIMPIVIVALIVVVWSVKTSQEKALEAEVLASAAQAQESIPSDAVNSPAPEPNTDFLLEATGIDLEQLKSHGLPIMIDFGADSCIPCKEMAPVLKKLNQEWQDKIIVKFVDVWKNPDAANDFPVQVIPTQFFFDADGNPFVPKDAEAMQMTMYLTEDTQEHVFTAHQGGMTEEQIKAVFEEMGAL